MTELMCRDLAGLVTPMPTFTASSPVPPRTRELLLPTLALYPMAIALLRSLDSMSACAPMAIFCEPVVLVERARNPMAVLLDPVLLLNIELLPRPAL